MIVLEKHEFDGAKIRVIGVGGCGGNAVNNMIQRGLTDVSFISANTDKQVLDTNLAEVKLQIGRETTKGLGAGGNPEVGKLSAEESIEEIKESLMGCDMVFVTAGMGGGTGTGAAPIVAKAAQEMDALVVAVVTKPFNWEGKRSRVADQGIADLKEHVDAMITIPNQKLLDITDKKATFKGAYMKADEILFNATRGISDIITKPGLVNVDFADVRSIMKGMGDALMGIGIATGDNRAIEATMLALNSPLLGNISIAGSKGVLVNITGNEEITTLHEVAQAVAMIEEAAGPDVNLIHGVVLVSEPMDELMVTVVATGFNNNQQEQEKPKYMSPGLTYKTKEQELFEKKAQLKVIDKPDEIRTDRGTFTRDIPSVISAMAAPKGSRELNDLDTPAYMRRLGKEQNQDTFNTDSTVESNNEKVHAGIGLDKANSLKNYDQPAFLRKIMD
jgi:cell division protein FtsZ